MTVELERLNRYLASSKPSATYKMIDCVAERRAAGKQVISLTAGDLILILLFILGMLPLPQFILGRHVIPRFLDYESYGKR